MPEDVQNDFLKYELSVTIILDEKDTTVLEVFSRLNTYTVTLNKLERLNARYFGAFKSAVFNLGLDLNRFWIDNNILTQKRIYRMGDAELCAELLIAMISGLKPGGKKTLEEYFKKYDTEFKEKDMLLEHFKKIIDIIGEIFLESPLAKSKFHEKGLFYSLFCVIYDSIYGLENSPAKKHFKITPGDYPTVREVLSKLDKRLRNLDEYKASKEMLKAFRWSYQQHRKQEEYDIILFRMHWLQS